MNASAEGGMGSCVEIKPFSFQSILPEGLLQVDPADPRVAQGPCSFDAGSAERMGCLICEMSGESWRIQSVVAMFSFEGYVESQRL